MIGGNAITDSHCPQDLVHSPSLDHAELEYDARIAELRSREYPMLSETTYLDHAGSALCAKSLMDRFGAEMMSNVFGNPHSGSVSSQLSTRRVEDIRLRVLRFFNADPDDFDVVFVANATAGIKLVQECMRDIDDGFWYGHHGDAHTSIIGVREVAICGHRCFVKDSDVEDWLNNPYQVLEQHSIQAPGLFAYPAQSNMDGRRLPLDWCRRLRKSASKDSRQFYSLLDASALVSTSPLDLGKAEDAPDFTVLSFYKIFGFPDLGALIVRNASGHVLTHRKYFGGGTVDMVACNGSSWFSRKKNTLHDQLEDGSLPFHNIIALGCAIDVHKELFGSMKQISEHTHFLARRLYGQLISLQHGNGRHVCEIYDDPLERQKHPCSYGAILAFNLRDSQGRVIGKTEIEKLSNIRNIHVRTGGLCNPGGIQNHLNWDGDDIKANFDSGVRCGDEHDLVRGKPTGAIRVSLGAMSTLLDVTTFVDFVQEFYVESKVIPEEDENISNKARSFCPGFHIESITVYPIKSCGGWKIPPRVPWEVKPEGLAWDREWSLVHQGTGVVLSQKRYPRMALLRPSVDLDYKLLRVVYRNPEGLSHSIAIPLDNVSEERNIGGLCQISSIKKSTVCGDSILAEVYTQDYISQFFSEILDVPCLLARFPSGNSGSSVRHSKVDLQPHQLQANPSERMPGLFPEQTPNPENRPLLFSNESPILLVSRSSINSLNEHIKSKGGKAASAEVFRANIVIAEDPTKPPGGEQPYVEDAWRFLQIGNQHFQMLGSCRRCNMICIDQKTAERNAEPFVTLAKTRRFNNKVYFGEHMALLYADEKDPDQEKLEICIGDLITAFLSSPTQP
ncbi:MAG: hypothetical protein M1834_007890 [Cirrosporium novae-zelandiae]|nr:MAG: hypothetical protein M1834_007890 [Cirrosporium novae-zelandiae]